MKTNHLSVKWQKIDYNSHDDSHPLSLLSDNEQNHTQRSSYLWAINADVCQSHKSECHFDLQLMQLISFYGYVKFY